MAKTKRTDPVDIHAGKRLRKRRELIGLSMNDLGGLLTPPKAGQQIQKYETGYNRMGFSVLWQISKILEVTPDYFAEGLDDSITLNAPEKDISLETVPSAEAKNLIKYYAGIQNQQMRKNILTFVKNTAKEFKKPKGEPHD